MLLPEGCWGVKVRDATERPRMHRAAFQQHTHRPLVPRLRKPRLDVSIPLAGGGCAAPLLAGPRGEMFVSAKSRNRIPEQAKPLCPSLSDSRPSGRQEQVGLGVRHCLHAVCHRAGHSASPSPKYVRICQCFPKSVVTWEAWR